jgi:hypothetical protein
MKMTKDASLTLQIVGSLHDEFMAAAEASDQSPSKVFRDLMQDFILQQSVAPDYLAFLQKKADIARSALTAGGSFSDEDVETDLAARRAAVSTKMRWGQ